MTKKYFEKTIINLIKIYDTVNAKDIAIEKALGGDTTVLSTDIPTIVDKMVVDLVSEMNDENGLIESLVFEHMMRNDYNDKKGFVLLDGKEYKATPNKIYKLLKVKNN